VHFEAGAPVSTPYDVLGVAKDAKPEEIKRAYRRAAKKAHPDRNHGDHSKMVALNGAYATVGDPEKRERYDSGRSDGRYEQTDEYKARDICLNLFAQMMESAPDSQDPIQLMRDSIRDQQGNFRQSISTGREKIKRLEKRKKRLKFTGKGVNFLLDLIENQVQKITEKITQDEENVRLGDLAVELLKSFACEPEEKDRAAAHDTFGPRFFTFR
jgi:curved DNA-binding protein CbpA